MLMSWREKLKYQPVLGEIFPEFHEYGKNAQVTTLLNHIVRAADYQIDGDS